MASEQAVPIINKSTFETIQIPFPPLQEQKAIAQILSDMDSEIEALQQKLEKYKLIKEGMMEKLLTGKVRLNE
jgi:type I restriction enzyme S subunit